MSEMFLKLEPKKGRIEGEALDEGHLGEIEVLGWGWGVSNNADLETTKDLYKHTTVDEVVIKKGIDKASLVLMGYCARGERIKKATLTCRKNDSGTKLEYLVIELHDIKVMDVDWRDGEHMMSESVRLRFVQSEATYKRQLNSGAGKGHKHFGYDISKHEAI